MKLFVIGVVSAFNPFILGEGESCLDECGGVGGKCENVCGTKGYCCNPSSEFGDCVEMIHYGMMIQKDYKEDFQCVQYNSNYSYSCDHPEYTLVELKSGVMCLRPFNQLATFDEATNQCHFDARSRLIGPGDDEDAKFMSNLINHQPMWLPPKRTNGQWRDYQTQFQTTWLNFAPRQPDGGEHDHLQLTKFGRVRDEPATGQAFFICGRDPYFTYSPVEPNYDYRMNVSDYSQPSNQYDQPDDFVMARIRPIGDYDEEPIYEDTPDDTNYIDMSQYKALIPDFEPSTTYPPEFNHYRGRR